MKVIYIISTDENEVIDMVEKVMLFPLAFYKKSKFNGSKGKWNYRIEKAEGEDGDIFKVSVWEGPECYDLSKNEKTVSEFPFSDEGMDKIVDYLNQI